MNDSHELISEALQYISPENRDTWLRVGAAIVTELGDAGFSIWDSWARQAKSYQPASSKSTWKSLKPGKITVGTLFFEAKQAGWSRPTPAEPTLDDILRESVEASDSHAYLARKRILAHGLRQTLDGRLIVPLRAASGQQSTLQLISPDGTKRFLRGRSKAGCWYQIGEAGSGPLCIAEGFATAASIHESTAFDAIVAFDCGNLLPVAQAIRKLHPDRVIVICADDDSETDGNPGLSKATHAAESVGACLAVPKWGQFRDGGTDFNDMFLQSDAPAVADVIRHAIAAGPHTPPKDPAAWQPVPMKEALKSSLEKLMVRYSKGDQLAGVPTGWEAFDRKLDGI